MAESDARPPATRSGAIYSSANLLYQLIEEESAYAIKPYKDALDALQSHLNRLSNENTALMQSAESSEKELDALKGILAENGLGVGSIPSGRASLHFIGDRAKLVGDLADEIERFTPEPSQPFSPVSLVQSLVQCCFDRNRRLGAAHWRYTNASAERDHLKRTVALRDATLESETGRWSAERTKLEADLKEEQAKVAALTTALSELRNEEQAINACLLTAQSESRDWEAKYHALETEFDSLTDVKANLAEQADAAKTELAQWTINAAAWDADQRQHNNQTARSTAFISQLQSDLLRLESLLRDANTECNQLQTTLRENNARALAENDTLAAELKELKRKYVEQASVLGPAAHHAVEAAPSGAARPSTKGSTVAQRKKSSRRPPTLTSTRPGFRSGDVMRIGPSLTLPDSFPASTSSISKGLPLPSLATTLSPPAEGTYEPSQAAISLKRPPPSPLASEYTKVTRARTADTPRHRSLPTSVAQDNDGPTVEPSARNPAHTRLTLTGDKPPLNDWESFVIDHQRERLYSYGGVAPYDKTYTPTSDFHCLNLRSMEWENIGPLLRFRTLNTQLVLKELPALNEPASSLTSVDGGTYMFLFGGHDPKSERVTADLIAINLDSFIWWYVDVPGPPVVPRMSASMVAIRNRIFIFGGRNKFEDDSSGIAAYSIAVYNPQAEWTWAVSDRPLPSALPPLGYSIRATPIDDGAEILLTRGYVDNSEPFSLSPDTIILFDTENHNFRTASETMGNFPSGIRWHLLGSIVAGGSPPENHSNFRPSVVLVAWVPHTDAEEVLVPEIWQYFLAPLPQIRCLNLRETFLNLDLHSFVAVGNRMLLFGSKEGHDHDEAHENLPQWDFAIEVSSGHLVN